MSVTELFRHLPPAYFTVTVNSTTIDEWKRYGGRTTFSARSTKTNDSIKLVPSISVIDCLTGQPLQKLQQKRDTEGSRLLGSTPLEQDTSRWRLPVLVFCGTKDLGLTEKDEEYLGNPIERNESCVIFSERWVTESVSAGGLLFLADYAKHAPDSLDIDDPSLYLPCPFPPTYHPSASFPETSLSAHYQNSTSALSEANTRYDSRSFHVLGPYVREYRIDWDNGDALDSKSSMTFDEPVSDPASSAPARPSDDSAIVTGIKRTNDSAETQKRRPRPLILHSERSSHFALPPAAPEPSPELKIAASESDAEHHSAAIQQETSRNNNHDQADYSDANVNDGDRARMLEDYIVGKKRAHTSTTNQNAALWLHRKKEAQERREEQLVEVELLDSGRSKSARASLVPTELRGCDHDWKSTNLVRPAPPRLQLEANTLLHLLPPLNYFSSYNAVHSGEGKRREQIQDSTPSSVPSYYPYLASPASALAIDACSPSPQPPWDKLEDRFNLDHQSSPGESSRECKTPQPKRVIAFHSSGYGVGWMDFQASDDWVCVAKKNRMG